MALDQSRIAIRERGYLDVLDLSLRVVREFAGPLALALAAGAAPLSAFNAWLLAGYADGGFETGFSAAHTALAALLVLFEAPLATAPVTLYLGRAAFTERPRFGEILRCYLASLPQLAVYQVLLRPFSIFRPYLTEVIVLDRNPMRSRDPRQPTTARRSRLLHHGEGSDLFARAVLSLLLGGALLAALWLSIHLLRGLLVASWEWTRAMFTVFYPLALWTVAGFMAVARFLSYLDLRIRREGWEVELLLRAEHARLTRSVS